MSWTPHVNKITSKASQSLGFVKRNLKWARQDTKVAAYNTLLRPILENCSAAWNPYQQKDIFKILAIQKCAARFAAKDYNKTPESMTKPLRNLQWTSLEKRREINRMTLFYKIVNPHAAIGINNYLELYTRQSREYHNQAYRPLTPTADMYKYFSPRTVIM